MFYRHCVTKTSASEYLNVSKREALTWQTEIYKSFEDLKIFSNYMQTRFIFISKMLNHL